MAHGPRIQVLEVTRWHLDQPLHGCGPLTASEMEVASTAKFTALQRAIQTAWERQADLVVLHSQVLSPASTAGRSPWFLARLISGCASRGIPVVWVESQHHSWMERHLPGLPVTRLTLGTMAIVETHSGPVRVTADFHEVSRLAEGIATVAVVSPHTPHPAPSGVDLVLTTSDQIPTHLDDWNAANSGRGSSLATLYTTRRDGSPDREPLAVSPVSGLRVECSVSSAVLGDAVASHLYEEIEAVCARSLATHSSLDLLIVDLAISNTFANGLWDRQRRADLIAAIERLRMQAPGRRGRWHLRSIQPAMEVDATCSFTPVVQSIWVDSTEKRTGNPQRLVDWASESGLPTGMPTELITADHRLASEARRAVIHRLRSAS